MATARADARNPAHALALDLQRSAGNRATSTWLESTDGQRAQHPPDLSSLTSAGRPLDNDLRVLMEGRFGHDFARVRIHSDAAAAEAASRQDARAFTLDHDVYFAAGSDPSRPAGQALLAHELTHVIQADAAASNSPGPANSIETLEGEARQVAGAFGSGAALPTIRGVALGLAAPLRQDGDDPGTPTFGNLPRHDPLSAHRLKLEKIGGKWYEITPEGKKAIASGWYEFVVQDGRIWAEKAFGRAGQRAGLGHTEAAQGGRVTYAGRISFTKTSGEIIEWNNSSGHHRAALGGEKRTFVNQAAKQAGLPMDKFIPDKDLPKKKVQLPVFQPRVEPTKPPSAKATLPRAPTAPASPRAPSAAPRTPTPGTAAAKGTAAPKATRPPRVLGSLPTLGKVSPFDAAMLYLDLHAAHFKALENVSKAVATANNLLARIDALENGARALSKATREQQSVQSELPSYPLQTVEEAGKVLVSAADLAYVEGYYSAAAAIANDAMATRTKLAKTIVGWDAILVQAKKTGDFTRGRIWEAVIELDLRFNNEGGNFRAFLADALERAEHVESWARSKQYHAADILGKWTPEGYQPPSGPY